ncbi:MAG TPA: MMPL family transporter [Gemmatimonadales bacterium]|nr:MMPL family transporter [Gemmatimonadales bacterium]
MTGTVLLAVLAGWGASRLALRQDLRDFLAEPPADVGRIPPDLLRELSGGDRLAIVLEADDSIPSADVARVFDALAPPLISISGVGRVVSRSPAARSRYLEEHFPRRVALYLAPGALVTAGERLSRSGMEARLLPSADSTAPDLLRVLEREARDPLGLLRLAAQPMRAWQGVARLRNIDGFLALPGGRTFFLLIDPSGPLDDARDARGLVASIDQVLERAREAPDLAPLLTGRRLYATGQVFSRVSTVNALQADGIRVAAAAAVAVALLLTLFFRRVVAPLAIIVTVTMGLLITAGAAGVGVGSVGLLAWMFSGLLVGLGDDYGVYICTQYWVHGSVDLGREEAVVVAVTRPGPGITMGALTSAAGFLALVLIPYTWTREVGVLAALSLLAILACSLTVLPLLLSFSRPAQQTTRSTFWEGLADRMGRSRTVLGLAPWLILVGAAALVLPTLHFQAHPWRIMARGNAVSAQLERLSDEAGAAFSPILIVSTGATPEQALERDREAVLRLRGVGLRAGVAAIQSLAQWLPPAEQQRTNLAYLRTHPDLFDPSRVRRDFAAVVARMKNPDPSLTEEYLPRILVALDPPHAELTLTDLRSLGLGEEVDRHLRYRDGSHLAVSYVYLRRLPTIEGVVPRFMAVARESGLTNLPGVTLAGAPLRAPETRVIRGAVLKAALLATLLVVGLLWLRFGRWSLVLLCLAPLVCGLSAAVLAMPLLGIEFNLLSAAIAPILIGTGVDDGIHMVDRLRAGQSVATVLREAGSCLVLTSLTTTAAFLCLGLATFTGIREVGLLGSVGMIASVLAAIHLVPLGWRWLGR